MLLGLFDYYSVYGVAKPGSVPFPAAMAGLSLWLWVPTVGLLAIYLVLLFPNGRLQSRRWRPLAWLSGTVILLASVGSGLSPGPIAELGGCAIPSGWKDNLGWHTRLTSFWCPSSYASWPQ